VDAQEVLLADLRERTRVDVSRLSRRLAQCFVEGECDAETLSFLGETSRRSGWARSWLHFLLTRFRSEFDVAGWLGTHQMFLFGSRQSGRLLEGTGRGALLDVGAGSGDVTRKLAPHFERVVVTERSAPMCRRLRAEGYECHALELGQSRARLGPFDAVALLNVLDRTDEPEALLEAALGELAPGGRLLISLPLPYRPCVYRGGRAVTPARTLPVASQTFEQGAQRLVEKVLAPRGLELARWTKLPYLSGGDAFQPLYVLDAWVGVCDYLGPSGSAASRPGGAGFCP